MIANLEQRLWGAVWVGVVALFAGGVLNALRWDNGFPWYDYLEVSDFGPSAVMAALVLLASSRYRIAAFLVWIALASVATVIGIIEFPHWGEGITDVSPSKEARFEGIGAVSAGLSYFAAAVMAAAGVALLWIELVNRRRHP